jgi:VanZ family protein
MEQETGKMTSPVKRMLYYWLPVAAWCSVIFLLSHIPGLKTDLGFMDFVLRKTAHVVEYAVLFLLTYRALYESGAGRKKAYIISAVFSVLYAASDEFHQSFVPGRGPSVADVGIDSFGVLAAYLTHMHIKIKK